MKHRERTLIVPLAVTAVAALAASFSGCLRCHREMNLSPERCTSNLRAIWFKLFEWVGDGDTLPPSLLRLSEVGATSNLFACPSTGHEPGPLSSIERWTDYVYIGNQTPIEDPHVAVLICPPENHGGEYGHVVWENGQVARLPATLVRSLVQDPWCMATNAPVWQRDYLRSNALVRIPDRFHLAYPRP